MLKTRMMILNQGNVIDNEIKDFMDASIDLLHEEYPSIEDEKFVMFTTHLAMASQRIKNGEIVELMDDAMFSQITQTEHFAKASDVIAKLNEIANIKFPESEQQYILLHLCNIF